MGRSGSSCRVSRVFQVGSALVREVVRVKLVLLLGFRECRKRTPHIITGSSGGGGSVHPPALETPCAVPVLLIRRGHGSWSRSRALPSSPPSTGMPAGHCTSFR